MPVFLTFPLLFCFAPAVLIILMSPSMMQLSDFLNPENPDNPLTSNETISTTRVADAIGNLNQDIRSFQQP
jgi:hypothetical protein